MSTLSRGDGYLRLELQALSLCLSSSVFPPIFIRWLTQGLRSDLSFLLASHQGKPQRQVSCMQERVHRRRCTVQAHQQGGVGVPHSSSLEVTHGSRSHKQLTQQKKQRERERKDLDTLGRRHLVNVRVVQRNVVYIVNMNPRFAKEEVSPTSAPQWCCFVTKKVATVNFDVTL